MRIERISENQIRCTLSKRDLLERHLKISELAYGSDKAKELFRDMMEQANMDFGFDADDIPLMIEAIPTSKESIVLVITKVEDSEEFEEKFSKFGNFANRYNDELDEEDDYFDEELDEEDDFHEDLINCFEQLNEIIESNADSKSEISEFIPLHELLKKGKKEKGGFGKRSKSDANEVARLFSFTSLNRAIHASKLVDPIYSGRNSIWKNEEGNRYYMILSRNDKKSPFENVCSLMGEYGKKETLTYATQDYFNEHYRLIIKGDAIKKLSMLA